MTLIFYVVGLLHSLTGYLIDCVCCRFHWGKYNKNLHNTFHSNSEPVQQPLITQPQGPSQNTTQSQGQSQNSVGDSQSVGSSKATESDT